MFGQMQLENFKEGNLPQKGQSAWDGSAIKNLTGANYKALIYLGAQPVNGTLHWFIAEQTIPYAFEIRHVVKLAILERDGNYSFVKESVHEIA